VLRVYLDGKEVASKNVGKKRVPGTTSLCIGRRQDGSFWFQGEIDEARLYDRALSADEVAAHSQDPQAANQTKGVVGYWPMDQAEPVTPEIQAVIDKAGLEPAYRDRLSSEGTSR